MIKPDDYAVFSRECYDFNTIRITDNISTFKKYVNTIEHHVFHTKSESILSLLITKMCPSNTTPIGDRYFRFTCSFCKGKNNIDIVDIHDFNLPILEKLVFDLSDRQDYQPTNILYTCGILGRVGWRFLPIYLISYRLDVLFSISLSIRSKIRGIIHMIGAMIFSHHHNTISLKRICSRESFLVSKFGNNTINMVLICLKMFDVFPPADEKTLGKFNINFINEYYYIVPSITLRSMNELLAKFDTIPVTNDYTRYGYVSKNLTHSGEFNAELATAILVNHAPSLQRCSREFFYYLGMNKKTGKSYMLSTHCANIISNMITPRMSYVHNNNLSAVGVLSETSRRFVCYNIDGELVFDYYRIADDKVSSIKELKKMCATYSVPYNSQINVKYLSTNRYALDSVEAGTQKMRSPDYRSTITDRCDACEKSTLSEVKYSSLTYKGEFLAWDINSISPSIDVHKYSTKESDISNKFVKQGPLF